MWVNAKPLDVCSIQVIYNDNIRGCICKKYLEQSIVDDVKLSCKTEILSEGGNIAELTRFSSVPYLSEAALSVHYLHWGQWAGSLCTR